MNDACIHVVYNTSQIDSKCGRMLTDLLRRREIRYVEDKEDLEGSTMRIQKNRLRISRQLVSKMRGFQHKKMCYRLWQLTIDNNGQMNPHYNLELQGVVVVTGSKG